MSEFRRIFIVAAAVLAPVFCAAGSKPDIENGKTTFQSMCVACHSVQTTGGAIIGPNLLGIVGRKAGSVPDFAGYSPALKDSKVKWSKKTLDKYLTDPNAYMQGTFMPLQIPDKQTRADIIAYLATLKK